MTNTVHVQSQAKKRIASAFTLVELLVVVAIIALLAAILFPVFSRARENARRTSCMNNLKQQSLAMMQYVNDNDEKFPGNQLASTTPPPPDGVYWSTGTWWWSQIIYSYHGNNNALYCPSHPPLSNPNPRNYNYGANPFILINGVTFPLSKLMAPSKTYLILDYTIMVVRINGSSSVQTPASGAYLPGASDCVPAMTGAPTTSEISDFQTGRHFQGVNVAFCDGHVKWLRSNVLVGESYKTGQGAWNPANT